MNCHALMKVTEPVDQRTRLLCVDDDELALLVSATILREEGYEVLTCSDPLRAAHVAQSQELDLAILDYEMPAMTGAELAAFCKAVNPGMKVILFSGMPTIPNHELAFADLFLQKGDSLEVLLEGVGALLGNV
jgi:CheY-like chemotaxis protein